MCYWNIPWFADNDLDGRIDEDIAQYYGRILYISMNTQLLNKWKLNGKNIWSAIQSKKKPTRYLY